MRILLYASGFTSLTQRAATDLAYRGHDLAVALDLGGGQAGARELRTAIDRHRPDLIIAPMLTTAIPADVWSAHTCLIVHPGPPGDRGPSSLDWAMAAGSRTWGVTVLQAVAEMDAGPVWAWEPFTIPEDVSKSSLYRGEVSDAAMVALLRAVDRYAAGEQPAANPPGATRPYYQQDRRRIDWARDSTAAVSLALRTADSSPGVLDEIEGRGWYLFGGQVEDTLAGAPGAFVAVRDGAVCRATADGAVWLTAARPRREPGQGPTAKAPAALALAAHLDGVPEDHAPLQLAPGRQTYTTVRYTEHGPVGHLALEFPSGALSTADCNRLLAAYHYATSRPTRVLVLGGGRDVFSTGIHLGAIEAAADPAEESWQNINAIDDVVEAILATRDQVTVAALGGAAAAGGLMLAAACDQVWARAGVTLNPHYVSMGLAGSELFTLTLPARVGAATAEHLTSQPLPVGAELARDLGLVDRVLPTTPATFGPAVLSAAAALAADPGFGNRLLDKHTAAYPPEVITRHRRQELDRMHRNFFGPDEPYHRLRREFLHKQRPTSTPGHLASLPATRTAAAAGAR